MDSVTAWAGRVEILPSLPAFGYSTKLCRTAPGAGPHVHGPGDGGGPASHGGRRLSAPDASAPATAAAAAATTANTADTTAAAAAATAARADGRHDADGDARGVERGHDPRDARDARHTRPGHLATPGMPSLPHTTHYITFVQLQLIARPHMIGLPGAQQGKLIFRLSRQITPDV